MMDIAIIGGGAAGFFSAISAKEHYPKARVSIFEKSGKVLAKVKISGGGRCNVTNACQSVKELLAAYPRGVRVLKKIFPVFNNQHAMEWFELRGVPLVIQEDNCVFPASQDSQSIIDCFLRETKKSGVEIKTACGVKSITSVDNRLELQFDDEAIQRRVFDKVIVATGASPKRQGLVWLENLGHVIEEPVPSLFTFEMPSERIRDLQGVVVENVLLRIEGTKIKSDGPLLVTHWGMSGPAILKLSAFGAKLLAEKNYEFKIHVNWVHETNSELVMNEILRIVEDHPKKLVSNYRPYLLPERLWLYFLKKQDISLEKRWGELGKKNLNQLVNLLSHDIYSVKGKSTFKEEFVTCGGISLNSIHLNSLESRVCENLYFAGEILDIDGITGGFNFQAAWSTGFVAGQLR